MSKLTVAGTIESTNGGVKFPDGTVQATAGITANQIVLVRDPDNPARQPVQASGDCTVINGASCSTVLLGVPAGKRLVIEYVSMTVMLGVAGAMAKFSLNTVNGDFGVHRFPWSQPTVAPALGGSRTATVSQQVRIYADPGTAVSALGEVSINTTGEIVFEISGHFVDLP